MNKESIEELRQRLLKEEQVREMISMRAYEIYQMRGGESGHEAEDWFRAENEILSFLIQEESRHAAEEARKQAASYSSPHSSIAIEEQGEGPRAFVPRTTPEIAERQDNPPAQMAEERADAQSELGVWSATEPESAQRAPQIGATPDSETQEPAKKKTRSRTTTRTASKSASKTSAPRKTRTTTAKKSPAKKAAATKKSSAKKPAASRKKATNRKQRPESSE